MNVNYQFSDCRNGQHEKRTAKFSEKQVEILEAAYSQWPQPFPDLLDQLVKETAMKPEELSEWFWQKNKTKVTECFNRQVKNTHVDQHGRQTKKEDSIILAKSKSVESRNSLEVGMNRTKINVKRDGVKKQNENYSNVKIKALKNRPISKVSEVTLKKIRVNQQKKSNDSVVETKDSQNIKLTNENDEIHTECEFCQEYFGSRTKLFLHMMNHVPPGIKEKLPKVEGELAWCLHCPGPVPVEQVNSHMDKCHMEVDVGELDMKDFELKTENGFESVEIKCDERSLVGSGIPNLMAESMPVLVNFIPEEFGKFIVNLEDFKLLEVVD